MQLIGLQFGPVWEDKASSHLLIEELLEMASPQRGALVVLPEMSDTGWSFKFDRIADQDTLNWSVNTAKKFGIHLQVGYAQRASDDKGYNCTTIIGPDGTIGKTYKKIHPFSFGDEPLYFHHGDDIIVERRDGISVCPTICYDLRFPELYRHGMLNGADVFTVIASWPIERAEHWRALAIARAIENQAYVIAVNGTGTDPHWKYGGGSLIISPQGEILAEGGSEPCVLKAHFDRPLIDDWRKRFPAIKDVHPHLLGISDQNC